MVNQRLHFSEFVITDCSQTSGGIVGPGRLLSNSVCFHGVCGTTLPPLFIMNHDILLKENQNKKVNARIKLTPCHCCKKRSQHISQKLCHKSQYLLNCPSNLSNQSIVPVLVIVRAPLHLHTVPNTR